MTGEPRGEGAHGRPVGDVASGADAAPDHAPVPPVAPPGVATAGARSTESSDRDADPRAAARDETPGGFVRHARTMSLLTLASRVLGLVREAAFARTFGAGPLADAFLFALLVPNLARRLFGEGALATAFLPAYAQLRAEDPASARALARRTATLLLAGLGGAVLVLAAVLLVIAALSPGAPPAEAAGVVADADADRAFALRLVALMLPFAPLVCTTAVLAAALQDHGRFAPGAAAPIVLNGFVLAALFAGPLVVAAGGPGHVALVAGAVLVAGVAQLAWAASALRRASRGLPDAEGAPDRARVRAALARVRSDLLPVVVGVGALQIGTLLDGLVASWPTTVGPTVLGADYPLDQGAMAVVGYAQRLYQFPLGVFGIAIATAVYPALARLAAPGADPGRRAFAAELRRGLRLTAFIGLPAAAGLAIVAPALVRALFEGGAFGSGDAARTARVLSMYALGVAAYSMNQVLARGFFARGDLRTPVAIALRMLALNLLLNVTLIWTPLRESALALSTALCATLQTVILLRRSGRDLAEAGPLIDADVRRSWTRALASTVLVGLVALAAMRLVPGGPIPTLAVAVVLGGVVHATSGALLRMPELRWALGRTTGE